MGSFLTYDILDDSVIVVRTAPTTLTAHHNVCVHRGRRLVDTPRARKAPAAGTQVVRVRVPRLDLRSGRCCTHIRERDDWQDTLTPQNTHLAPVHVDTWGGWLFVNLDPDCESLGDYLEPAARCSIRSAAENMRVKWRKWLNFDCNWKVAIEAFNETYHVVTTHPEFNKFGVPGLGQSARQAQQYRLRRAQRHGGHQVARFGWAPGRSADLDSRDAGVHAEGNQRHHHEDPGGRCEATGRRTSRTPRPTRC